MLKTNSVFSFSPRIGRRQNEEKSGERNFEGFYPKKEQLEEIMSTSYKVVDFFLKNHIPKIELVSELASNQDSNQKKIYAVELFNPSFGNINSAKLVFSFKNKVSRKIFFANSKEDAPMDDKNINWQKLELTSTQNGFISGNVSILRRSYIYLRIEADSASSKDFVVIIERDTENLAIFSNVKGKKNMVSLFKPEKKEDQS